MVDVDLRKYLELAYSWRTFCQQGRELYLRPLEPLVGIYKPPDGDSQHRSSIHKTCPIHA